MLTAMTLLILAQAYAEASSANRQCYGESNYPNLAGVGTQSNPYILSSNKCLRIVNSHKDRPYYAIFPLYNNALTVSIAAITTDNNSCEGKNDCVNKEKHVLLFVKDTNGDNQHCGGIDKWLANCTYGDYIKKIPKGNFFINVSSRDSELVDLSIQSNSNEESNFNPEIK